MFRTTAVEKIKTHIFFVQCPVSENRAVYEIMWENVVEPDSPQMAMEYDASALHDG